MNSIHNNGPDDKRLNDDLEKLGQAYQQHLSEEPPELLDQAILSSAHRAVEGKDHWLDFGWIHGLTTAAVVVLALSIILTQRQPTGLEENGLSPTDASTLGRSRAAESELSGKLREQRSNEAEYKQEESEELRNELRKDMRQTMPAASSAEARAGARDEPVAARQAQEDFRVKKSMQSEEVLLQEEIIQVNAPAKTMLAEPPVMEFADEAPLAEAAEVEIDAIKSDADKMDAERSQPATEEAQLQAILMLKQAGDERWKAELKTFIGRYPEYPLPDELKN